MEDRGVEASPLPPRTPPNPVIHAFGVPTNPIPVPPAFLCVGTGATAAGESTRTCRHRRRGGAAAAAAAAAEPRRRGAAAAAHDRNKPVARQGAAGAAAAAAAAGILETAAWHACSDDSAGRGRTRKKNRGNLIPVGRESLRRPPPPPSFSPLSLSLPSPSSPSSPPSSPPSSFLLPLCNQSAVSQVPKIRPRNCKTRAFLKNVER